MLILSILISLVWLVVTVVVIAICRMAARGDSDLAEVSGGGLAEVSGSGLAEVSQSPRLPSTCGTVRSRILTSPQSDQFAT
jgi:hypothetical protein